MAETKMQLEDWLDDLCVRFIIHLPKEDLSSVARICFQVEEAQWFYEDFIRPLDPTLPSMSLRSFCLRIFQHCPLLAPFSAENHMRAFEEFMQYKTRVPVRGAILLNEAMDSTVLVKGWKKGANWSFPRGKINKDEDDLDCAIREVYEETGFDIKKAGLVPKDDEVKYIQISMREQQIRLYIFRNIPMDTVFEPKTRKEISKVEWYKLSELPAFRKKGSNSHDDAAAASNANKFYMVAPFLVPLKKWVVQQRKKDGLRAMAPGAHLGAQAPAEEPFTEDDIGTQPEPVAPPSNGAPAIETLEGATRELQRLLKVQPPTQGLQMTPSASNADKGGALMALLQKGAEGPPHQGAQQAQHSAPVPHTPSDHTYTNPPEPHAPHHHHPTHRLPAPNHQPPPTFPIPTGSFPNASSGYMAQHGGYAQGPPQVYGRNPFANQAREQRSEPVLLHPQPLPPQVQQSILTRGILPTPGVPEQGGPGGQHGQAAGSHVQPSGQHTQQGGPSPFYAQRSDTYALQQQQQQQQQARKPTQLTGHAMTLLNAFKSGPREGTEDGSRGNTPQDHASQQSKPQHPPTSWVSAPAAHAPNPAAQFLPHHMAPAGPMRTSPRAVQPRETQHGPKPTQPPESHRAVLLDMFRKSGPRSPLSNEIRVPSGGASQSPGTGIRDEPISPSYKALSGADMMAPTAELRMNPDANLPYRALQVQSRPKQAEHAKSQDLGNTQAQMQRLQQRLGSSGHDSRSVGRQGLPSPRDRTVLQQSEQEAKRSPQLNYAAAQAASIPYAQYSPSNAHSVPLFQQPQHHPQHQHQPQQPSTMPQRRQDSNPEQRQKLLSLFSKEQQPSPTGFAADEKGKGKETATFDQPGHPRSRVASFASAGGNEPVVGSAANSRRGSQTPISPADRNFLLSYLESVTNPGR